MKIAKESWIIAAIGLADLVTTIIFIQHHGAQEANPLFRRYWDMGIPAFILAKLVCLLGPLLVLEWARKRNPQFVNIALRSAIAGYLLFYCVGFVQLNAPRQDAAREESNYFTPTAGSSEMTPARQAVLRWRERTNRRIYVGSSLAWKPISETLLQYRRTGRFIVARMPISQIFMIAPMAKTFDGQNEE